VEAYAITLFPFVFIRDEGDERVIRHESIHIIQYAELFVVGFLFLYAYDFIKGCLKHKNIRKAYGNVRFEQEAYAKEGIENYLNTREKFAWRKYSL
jgi:hypothetical protein